MTTRSKLVKIKGEFVWHTHDHTDEFFLVIERTLTIQIRDRDVMLGPGRELPWCHAASSTVLGPPNRGEGATPEPTGVINTGDAGGELTAVTEEVLTRALPQVTQSADTVP